MMECEMMVCALDKVGLKRENKDARAEFPASDIAANLRYEDNKKAYADILNTKFVEEGWTNDTSLGSQRSIVYSGENIVLNFSRHRFVKADPIVPTMFVKRDEQA